MPQPWGWAASSSAGAASGSVPVSASSGWAASPPLVASGSAASALAMVSSVWNSWPSNSAISASMSLLQPRSSKLTAPSLLTVR